MRGGPGTSDPARLAWENVPMLRLLAGAYGFDFDQIDAPKWIDSERYTLVANLPAGTSKADLQRMLQRLLRERFHLAAHLVRREFRTYELVVAKNGPRLARSAGDPGRPAPGALPTLGPGGFPALARGSRHAAFQPIENGEQVTRETFRDYTMAQLVQDLAWPLAEPSHWDHAVSLARIVDKTGLTGAYDFKLYYAQPQPTAGGQPSAAPSLFDAVQQQLGLKIQEGKALLDAVVVDRLDRLPAR